MAFVAKDHLSQIKGKDYLEVKWRIVWFRDSHPDGGIQTDVISVDPPLVRASVVSSDGKILATGYGTGNTKTGSEVWSGREIEKAETAAIGRALAHAGFGTQFTNDTEGEHLADAPVQRKTTGPRTGGSNVVNMSTAAANLSHNTPLMSDDDWRNLKPVMLQYGLKFEDIPTLLPNFDNRETWPHSYDTTLDMLKQASGDAPLTVTITQFDPLPDTTKTSATGFYLFEAVGTVQNRTAVQPETVMVEFWHEHRQRLAALNIDTSWMKTRAPVTVSPPMTVTAERAENGKNYRPVRIESGNYTFTPVEAAEGMPF